MKLLEFLIKRFGKGQFYGLGHLLEPQKKSFSNQPNDVYSGNFHKLPLSVKKFVEESVVLCQPAKVHICDGSNKENDLIIKLLEKQGTIKALSKYQNCWLATTNPEDVARVESRTFICTKNINEAIPTPKCGIKGTLGNWMSYEDMSKAINERFPGCMMGRTMYVIPFSMGPIGSPLSKIGIEITDSPYVVASMRIMTRMSDKIWTLIHNNTDFVKCLHSVGLPIDGISNVNWPCDPERTLILHKPETNEIVSYGSGYGGNSLLGKKCFALRIGSTIARREGWLAEHMLILGITDNKGKKRYIAAAFPSACGKTNLAMMTPSLPGFKVECVGDDIAWMKFDSNGQLRAINPENGFFGVAPGTSTKTNPNAMNTIFNNTIFTNVAETSDGGVFWEGLDDEIDKNVIITDWCKKPWNKQTAKSTAAHPNSRFCTPAKQCPIIDPDWESPNGVPIDAILFGGRRPEGIPLIYESFDWNHGVFLGATMRSEATAAAEFKGKVIMHDPFAMRPFFGYNFGHYLQHWLSMKNRSNKLPKIFHVNWFRKDSNGKFLWPGFGENARVLQWILRRIDNDMKCAEKTAIGFVPKKNEFNMNGLNGINFEELFTIEKDFWYNEIAAIQKYFDEQLPQDVPHEILDELNKLQDRINNL